MRHGDKLWKFMGKYYRLLVLLVLLAGCVGKTKKTAVADTARWPTDSIAFARSFDAWVRGLMECSDNECLSLAYALIADKGEDPMLQLRLAEKAELYFNDPNSPYRNEAVYISVLEALISAPGVDPVDKIRPCFQLQKAMMNRPGSEAADLSLLNVSGESLGLGDVKAEYTLLYFFNPDCHDCGRVSQYIATRPVFVEAQMKWELCVLAVYPDEDLGAWQRYKKEYPVLWTVTRYAPDQNRDAYYLPAIPTLYLLDREKRVILKDASVEQIEHWIKTELK